MSSNIRPDGIPTDAAGEPLVDDGEVRLCQQK